MEGEEATEITITLATFRIQKLWAQSNCHHTFACHLVQGHCPTIWKPNSPLLGQSHCWLHKYIHFATPSLCFLSFYTTIYLWMPYLILVICWQNLCECMLSSPKKDVHASSYLRHQWSLSWDGWMWRLSYLWIWRSLLRSISLHDWSQ